MEKLEVKLRKVRDGLNEELCRHELREGDYFKKIYEFLADEGVVTGSYEKESRVAIGVGLRLEPKINAREHSGLRDRYVARIDVPLSEEARKDIEQYDSLTSAVESYLRKEIGDRKILMTNYEQMIESYLNSQTDLPQLVNRSEQRIGAVKIAVRLEMKFNIEKPPRKPDMYDQIISVLERI